MLLRYDDIVNDTDTLANQDVSMTQTTVRIPDDLLILAKSACVTEKTSVNKLLLEGLRIRLEQIKTEKADSTQQQ